MGRFGWVWPTRLAVLLVAVWVCVYAVAQPAVAAPVMPADGDQAVLPFLSWIELPDSHGIQAWKFQLSLDTGDALSPQKMVWSTLTLLPWAIYQGYVMLALWFLEFVLSFAWLEWVAAPLIAVGDAMQALVNSIGLAPTLLTLAALMGGLLILKGRHATAVWEIGMACLIAALASGMFSQPVRAVAGADGLLVQANRAGQEIAATLASGGVETDRTAEQLRQSQLSQLVDVFLRQPSQLINFGKVLDGGPCEGVYNDAVKGGPYLDSTLRDKVGGCDKTAGKYAANPSVSMATGSYNFMPAAAAIILLAVMLGGSVIVAGVWVIFQALKATVLLVVGVVPGASRGSLMLTIAQTAVSLLLLIFNSVFLSTFLLVIQAVLTNTSGQASPAAFMIIDVVMFAGIVVYVMARRRILAGAQQLAQRLSWRPGGGGVPTSLPQRHSQLGSSLATVGRTALSLAQLKAQRSALNRPPSMTMIDARQQAAIFGWGGQGGRRPGPSVSVTVPQRRSGRVDHGVLPAGPDAPQLPAGPGPGPGSGGPGGGVAKAIAGTALQVGAQAALAAATGGGSVALTAAKTARVAQTVRRAQVVGRLATAAGRTATTASRPPGRAPASGEGPLIIRGEVVPDLPTRPPAAGRGASGTPVPPRRPAPEADRGAAARLKARLNADRAARLATRRTRG